MRIALLLPITALAACSAAEGTESSPGRTAGDHAMTFDVAGFDRIALEASPNVIAHSGDAVSVRAEGDPEALARLDIRVERNTLRIGYKKDRRGAGFKRDPHVTIHVTAPRITAASIAGSGDIRLDRAAADSFSASISGSGDIDIGVLAVQQAQFSVAGSGTITAAGSATDVAMRIMGSGDIDAKAVTSRRASISIAGAGNALANAAETAKIEILGSGDVTLTGSARCAITKMGSGTVHCGTA
jgi:hypothetical protein